MRWPLEPRHVRVIRRLDNAWLGQFYTTRPGGRKKRAGPLTPAAFDALFAR
ncbi:hypothetical protein [Amaricoccus sp.]|uniref:hypothetical protein n=1 Tax=Amaricoccus sp. TaxID=1872485 RepID=UPI0025B91750|nr:hypothetical protein [Amaricoccus sp.]